MPQLHKTPGVVRSGLRFFSYSSLGLPPTIYHYPAVPTDGAEPQGFPGRRVPRHIPYEICRVVATDSAKQKRTTQDFFEFLVTFLL
jgi:hypothetical protein